MPYWTTKQESNLQKVLDDLNKKQNVQSVVVDVYFAPGARAPRKNYQIMVIQEKMYKRIPFFNTAEERKKIASLLKTAIKNTATPVEAVNSAASQIGQAAANVLKKHIDEGISKQGAMPGLQPKTITAKTRKGTSGNPILKDTGDLYNSITYRVRPV